MLLPDERILASARASLKAGLYATNKRVIRYSKGFFQEKVDSLYYPHIVGTVYERHSDKWKIVLGGIAFLLAGVFLNWFFHQPFERGAELFGDISSVILAILGVVLIVAGIFQKPEAWYQIKAVGLDKEELPLWRTADAEPDSRGFATFIRHQISVREMPPPPLQEREVITKEVVMVKCEYCGGLMPETSTFCPNCGARR